MDLDNQLLAQIEDLQKQIKALQLTVKSIPVWVVVTSTITNIFVALTVSAYATEIQLELAKIKVLVLGGPSL